MKFNLAILLPVVLLGAAQVGAQCVAGNREVVIPNYEVEYQCNTYRTGKLHSQIDSIEACARLCRDADSSHCSYSPSHEQCVVGKENGEDRVRSGVYYMKRLNEDPFPEGDPEENPFPESCEENLAAYEQQKNDLSSRLSTCEANTVACGLSLTSPECPRDTQKELSIRCKTYKVWCGRYHNPEGAKDTVTGVTFPECIGYCSHRSWCTYVLHSKDDHTCRVFDHRVTYTQIPTGVTDGWKCAVKKP